MNFDEQDRPGWVRLPPADPADEDTGAGRPYRASRADGVRHLRRASNWTAAALVAGVAAASGYFAHQTPPAAPAAGQAVQAPPAGQGQVTGHPAVAGPRPASGSAPVVTSGGSGVAVGPVTGAAGNTASGTRAAGGATIAWRDS